jgi:Concanavalin A-like lectin/glucanases superfamily
MSRGFGSTFGAGSSDVVIANTTASPTTAMTVAIWLWENGAGGGNIGRAFDQYNSASVGSGIDLFAGSSTWGFGAPTAAGNIGKSTTTSPGSQRWVHACATLIANPASMTIYFNGVFADGSSNASTITNLGSNWYIGNREDASRNWDGMLAHFSIWNGIVLPQTDITALASGVSPLLIRPDQLVSYLPLDGINKPEADLINGFSSSITGTRLGTSEPMVQPLSRIRRIRDYEAKAASASTFKAAWAIRNNRAFTGSGQ